MHQLAKELIKNFFYLVGLDSTQSIVLFWRMCTVLQATTSLSYSVVIVLS